MGWIFRYRIPVGATFSIPVKTGSGAHPASCTRGTVSLSLGVKRTRRGVDHATPSSEVKERIVLYIYSPCDPWWPVLGWKRKVWERNKYIGIVIQNTKRMDKVCSRCDACEYHPIAARFSSELEHQLSRNEGFSWLFAVLPSEIPRLQL